MSRQTMSFDVMKHVRKGVKMLIAIAVLLAGSAILFAACSPRLGAAVRGEGLLRLERSEHFDEGRFHNTVPTRMGTSEDGSFGAMMDFFKGSPDRTPARRLPCELP